MNVQQTARAAAATLLIGAMVAVSACGSPAATPANLPTSTLAEPETTTTTANVPGGALLPGSGPLNLDETGLLGATWGSDYFDAVQTLESRLGDVDDDEIIYCPGGGTWRAATWSYNDATSQGTLRALFSGNGNELAGWEISGTFPGLRAEPLAPGTTFADARLVLGNDFAQIELISPPPPVGIPAIVSGPYEDFPHSDTVIVAVFGGPFSGPTDDSPLQLVRLFGSYASKDPSSSPCVDYPLF